MAEVLYRYKTHSLSTLIDVYESLQGRLRGSQSHSQVYAPYEELILLRLSFLHAAKASNAVLKQAKRIKWPCSIRFPFHFSDAEVISMRGFFLQLQEELMRIPVERRSSWRDFHPLHQELMELVARSAPPGEVSGSGGRMLNSVRYRTENLRGLRVFGKTTPTRTPPTWTNLSPSWEEDMEIPVSSARAILTVSVMNRTRRNSRWQDADTIGYV
ncbi:hypothetical protein PHYSODRAFT_455188, partial [Phytophthora sojae]